MKLGDRDLGELSKMIREEQKKKDDLEKIIRSWKSQSKKRSRNENQEEPRHKRPRVDDSNHRSSEGSREHLFATSSKTSDSVSRYDERVELAIDENKVNY